MNRAFVYLLILTFAVLVNAEDIEITSHQINDHLYQLNYQRGNYSVNMLLSVGKDGALMVDTGQDFANDSLLKKLQEFDVTSLDIIINTHEHNDHIGGNILFGKNSVIIAHKVLRERLRNGADHIFQEHPDYVLPDVGITEETTVFFNGDEIKIIPLVGSHDDNDLLVMFMESKVACLGDISCGGSSFPSYDEASGNCLKYPEVLRKVVEIVPDDFVIVPGHGSLSTVAEHRKLAETLQKSIDIIKDKLDEGKTVEDLIGEDVLSGYEEFTTTYVIDKNSWISFVYDNLVGNGGEKDSMPELYNAWKSGGVEEIVKTYNHLKNNPEYYCGIENLYYIGKEFGDRGLNSDAIAIYKLAKTDYPDHSLYWYMCYSLGKVYEADGKVQDALREYKEALNLNPDNELIKKKIDQLEAK